MTSLPPPKNIPKQTEEQRRAARKRSLDAGRRRDKKRRERELLRRKQGGYRRKYKDPGQMGRTRKWKRRTAGLRLMDRKNLLWEQYNNRSEAEIDKMLGIKPKKKGINYNRRWPRGTRHRWSQGGGHKATRATRWSGGSKTGKVGYGKGGTPNRFVPATPEPRKKKMFPAARGYRRDTTGKGRRPDDINQHAAKYGWFYNRGNKAGRGPYSGPHISGTRRGPERRGSQRLGMYRPRNQKQRDRSFVDYGRRGGRVPFIPSGRRYSSSGVYKPGQSGAAGRFLGGRRPPWAPAPWGRSSTGKRMWAPGGRARPGTTMAGAGGRYGGGQRGGMQQRQRDRYRRYPGSLGPTVKGRGPGFGRPMPFQQRKPGEKGYIDFGKYGYGQGLQGGRGGMSLNEFRRKYGRMDGSWRPSAGGRGGMPADRWMIDGSRQWPRPSRGWGGGFPAGRPSAGGGRRPSRLPGNRGYGIDNRPGFYNPTSGARMQGGGWAPARGRSWGDHWGIRGRYQPSHNPRRHGPNI